MNAYAMVVIYPVAQDKQADVLAALNAAAPHEEPSQPKAFFDQMANTLKVTKCQQEITAALTNRTLNDTQIGVLEAHLRNFRGNGGHLSIASVAKYLVEHCNVENLEIAAQYVEGALRSFGKRLKTCLSTIPTRHGRDRMGDGVADEVPLLAMFSIVKDDLGQTRHRLTEDGAAAVSLALGAKASGIAATSSWQEGDNLDELVGLSMSVKAAALIERVAKTMGVTREEAILHMTSMAGAG